MLPLFIILTVLSLLVLIIGAIWTVLTQGETRRRSGTDVGAEIMAEQMADERDGYVTTPQTAFKGKATAVEGEASISLAEVKQQLRSGHWRQMLPVLLTIAGLMGLLAFGALTAWVAIDNKLIAGLIALVAAYTLVRTVLAIARG